MFTIFKRFGWPATAHAIDGTVGNVNGKSSRARYGWHRWERWCIAYDTDNGQVFSFVDGDFDGDTKVDPDTQFKDPTKRANAKIKDPNMVTDVLIGCQLAEDTASIDN